MAKYLNPKTGEIIDDKQYQQRYGEPPPVSQFPVATQILDKPSFLQDAVSDIKGIGSGIAKAATKRTDNFAAASETKNPLRRTFQQVGQGAGFASDVIGNTVLGVGKAAAPQGVENVVKGGLQAVGGAVMNSDPAKAIAQKYAEIKQTNPTLARDIDAALGIGMLGLDMGTAGLSGQAAKQTAKVAGKGASAAGNVAAKGGAMGAKLVSEGQGALVGTGGESIRQAFMSGYKGGTNLTEFTKYLRNQGTPEELVRTVRENVDVLQNRRSQAYGESIGKLGGDKVDTKGLIPEFTKAISEVGITTKNGALDFSRSKFSTVPAAQSKIQQAYEELTRLGDGDNLQRIDTSRQALGNLRLAGEDNAANTANYVIDRAIDSVRKSGTQVEGYEKMLNKFSEESEFLNEVSKSLSAGDNVSIETAFKKITSSLRINNEQRLDLLKQLDEATDGAILGQVAGQQLSEALPRGIIRQILAPAAAVGAVYTGTIFQPQTLLALLGLSPRVAGEFARGLGITGRKLQGFMDGLEKTRRIVKYLGIDPKNLNAPLPSALVQGAQPDEQ